MSYPGGGNVLGSTRGELSGGEMSGGGKCPTFTYISDRQIYCTSTQYYRQLLQIGGKCKNDDIIW